MRGVGITSIVTACNQYVSISYKSFTMMQVVFANFFESFMVDWRLNVLKIAILRTFVIRLSLQK